jgi:hypothetical protein
MTATSVGGQTKKGPDFGRDLQTQHLKPSMILAVSPAIIASGGVAVAIAASDICVHSFSVAVWSNLLKIQTGQH